MTDKPKAPTGGHGEGLRTTDTGNGVHPNSSTNERPANTGNLDALPKALRMLAEWPQWVFWKLETRDGKQTKVLYDPHTGRKGDSTDPAKWATYAGAVAAYRRYKGDGVGFVFHPETSPVMGVDLDHCLTDGKITETAAAIVDLLDCYTEVSPSGTGLHLLMAGAWPHTGRKCPAVEVYAKGRYFTVTGNHFEGTPDAIEDRTAALAVLYDTYFPTKKAAPPSGSHATTIATGYMSDAEVLQVAFHAKNGGNIEALYNGNAGAYPSPSEADAALACHLAFYTKDRGQLTRLMLGSRLRADDREKWDREDYLPRTIDSALATVQEQYQAAGVPVELKRKGPRAAVEVDPSTGEILEGRAPADVPKVNLAPDGYLLSESGNAERFIDSHGDNTLFTEGLGWLQWDGSRWATRADEEMLIAMKESVREIYKAAAGTSDDDQRKRGLKYALAAERATPLKGATTMAQGTAALRTETETLDASPFLLNFINGTVDLRDGKLRPARLEDRITKMVPLDFDPTATCPHWEAALEGIFAKDPDPKASAAAFQRLIGYGIVGDTRERVIAVLHGGGRNGKSTVLETIANVLGLDYVRAARADILLEHKVRAGSATPELAALRGTRIVTLAETGEDQRMNEGLVKQLTGGDTISARGIYKDVINFRPEFLPILATNHRPRILGRDEAIWDRLVYVPFLRRFVLESEDPDAPVEDRADLQLKDKLAAEYAGIAAWVVRGAVEWWADIARGKSSGLSMPAHWRAAKADYRKQENSVGRFVDEECVQDRDAKAPGATLYAAYKESCSATGDEPVSSVQFGRVLSELGFKPCVVKKNRSWQGLRLSDMYDSPQDNGGATPETATVTDY